MIDGTPDSGFGSGGFAVGPTISGSIVATGLTQLPSGAYVGCGTRLETGYVFSVNADGSVNTGFGSGGWTSVDTGSVTFNPVSIAYSSGYLYLVATKINGLTSSIALLRMNSSGVLDASFGTGGYLLLPKLVDRVSANIIKTLANNSMVVVGRVNNTRDDTYGGSPGRLG